LVFFAAMKLMRYEKKPMAPERTTEGGPEGAFLRKPCSPHAEDVGRRGARARGPKRAETSLLARREREGFRGDGDVARGCVARCRRVGANDASRVAEVASKR